MKLSQVRQLAQAAQQTKKTGQEPRLICEFTGAETYIDRGRLKLLGKWHL